MAIKVVEIHEYVERRIMELKADGKQACVNCRNAVVMGRYHASSRPKVECLAGRWDDAMPLEQAARTCVDWQE